MRYYKDADGRKTYIGSSLETKPTSINISIFERFVSVPITLSDLASARTVIAELRDALVTAGVMEEEA